MNILIVGGSSGLGRALAEEGARRGHALLLCSSDARDLMPLASNLRLQYGVEVSCLAADVCVPEQRRRVVQSTLSLGPLDAVFLPIGMSRRDDTEVLNESEALQVLNVNFFAQVCLLKELWPHLAMGSAASVVGFGSIADIRGRRRNIIYAASKRALSSYFESLRALANGTRISVQFYRLGYMKTQQSFGKRLLLPVVSPERVARMVFGRLGKEQKAIYYPRWWRSVAVALRSLPWAIYRRLDSD
jgi:short-subunit dehydrogenase